MLLAAQAIVRLALDVEVEPGVVLEVLFLCFAGIVVEQVVGHAPPVP